MTQETTVTTPRTDAADIAAPDKGAVRPTLPPVERNHARTEPNALLGVPPAQKRKKTAGEITFDVTTYGGLALLGNELTASAIIGTAEKGIDQKLIHKPLEAPGVMNKVRGVLGMAYANTDKLVQKLSGGKVDYLKPGHGKPVSRFTYILFAIIGGFTMVPFIKALEDNKGKAVQFLDRLIHGKNADTDPNMVKAHQEMESAPKQTWGSLMNGRITTVAAAYAFDTTFNYEHGLSAKLLKGTKAEKWSSLEGISNRFVSWGSDHIANWRKLDVDAAKSQKHFLGTAFSLLTLSAALTVLFYASSKLFARGQGARRDATPAAQPDTSFAVANTRSDDDSPTQPASVSERPRTQIAKVENLSRLTDAPQLQAGV